MVHMRDIASGAPLAVTVTVDSDGSCTVTLAQKGTNELSQTIAPGETVVIVASAVFEAEIPVVGDPDTAGPDVIDPSPANEVRLPLFPTPPKPG